METFKLWVQYLGDHVITLTFATVYLLFVFYLLRLHFSAKYQHFDMASMVTDRAGHFDFGKFRVAILFFATVYGFFYVLHHHVDMLVSYTSLLISIWLTHHVFNKKADDSAIPPKKQPEVS